MSGKLYLLGQVNILSKTNWLYLLVICTYLTCQYGNLFEQCGNWGTLKYGKKKYSKFMCFDKIMQWNSSLNDNKKMGCLVNLCQTLWCATAV